MYESAVYQVRKYVRRVMGYGLWVMGKSEKCWCITVLGGGLGVVEDVALGLKCQDDMKCPVDIKY
jgi:hypothetical protein